MKALMIDQPPVADATLLRFLTCGSVDDGKSTLIGRLLYDSKSVFEDQLAAVERSSRHHGDERVNLALLTDGLRAEREQGITIDVAYRYFATPRRKFIIADAPGHKQYTRNMATGASTVDLAIVLVDARHGVIEQTRRHALIVSLLGIRSVVLAVNKMDLIGWDHQKFEAIKSDFLQFAAGLPTPLDPAAVLCVPMSALDGDNVVFKSERTPWYEGPALLEHLETVEVVRGRDSVGGRLPVQWVIRPQASHDVDFRGYAGQVAAGSFSVGDAVVALPSGKRSTIAGISLGPDQALDEAFAPQSVVVTLADEIDVSRGDLLCPPADRPHVGQDVEATVVWMADAPLRVGKKYGLKHTTRKARAIVREVRHRIDVSTGNREEGVEELGLNEIGRIALRTTSPLVYDDYGRCRSTGSFILIDEATRSTVAAGMIVGPNEAGEEVYSI